MKRSLEGLSLGDAFGERFFVRDDVFATSIKMRRIPANPPWRWTDDTAMALSIVEQLSYLGGIEPSSLAAAFARRYAVAPDRGYGGGAHTVLRDIALGEAWTRALVARGCGREPAGPVVSPDALVHSVSLDDRTALRTPCPSHVGPQCWSEAGEGLVSTDDLVKAVHKDLDKLAAKGVEIVAVRSVILCTWRLNEGINAGKNRFLLDLHAMERLILDLCGVPAPRSNIAGTRRPAATQ